MQTDTTLTLERLQAGLILPVNKPEGWTSFDVVKKLRNAARIKKVGHAGTLDPFATGLLLICLSRATKQVPQLMALEKEYLGIIRLGQTMDTDDRTGRVLKEAPVPPLTGAQIEETLEKFRGEVDQIPPMFSAIKQGGKRLYKLARQGKLVERKARKVHIHTLELLELREAELSVRVVCSRGTYIRALARDIGEVLGCGAYLHALQRTRIGHFELATAWEVDTLAEKIKELRRAHGSL